VSTVILQKSSARLLGLTDCIIDSGSEVNLLSLETWKMIMSVIPTIKLKFGSSDNLYSFSGAECNRVKYSQNILLDMLSLR